MRKRRMLVVVVTVAGVGLLAGIAFALWSSTGSGGGKATALTAVTVTVNAGTGTPDLYPGGAAGAVYFTLTNPNPYAVSFDKVTAASVIDVDGGIGGSPVCTTTDLSVSPLPITGFTPVVVAASSTSATRSIPGVVAMTSGAPNACQGAAFTVSMTLTGSQV